MDPMMIELPQLMQLRAQVVHSAVFGGVPERRMLALAAGMPCSPSHFHT